MSEDQPPVARMLDFSNVGVPTQSTSSSIHNDDSDSLPEQSSSRVRTESEFAIGARTFAARAYGRERRRTMIVAPRTNQYNGISISLACRRAAAVPKTLFNPMSLDQFYTKPCPTGHTRIFRQLLESSDPNIQATLLVNKPLLELKAYIQSIPKEFSNLYVSSKFKFKLKSEMKPNPYTTIWSKFIQIRHQMCRLVHIWLIRKSYKRMMVIPNYETMEDPKPSNCIEWLDIPNRCSYRIHGDTLLKSMKMYLHHSEYGFPDPLWPKNPTTNSLFTLGQIQHIIYELYTWCGKNKKPVPYILTKFQEADFCLKTLIVKNRPELTLYACRELFLEIHLPDAIEMWLDMVEEFATFYPGMSRDELETELPRWILSLEASTELKHKREAGMGLIAKWKSILPDLVQFSRFKYFNRAEWEDLHVLKKMVKGLWANTYHRVKAYTTARRLALLAAGGAGAAAAADDDASTETASEASEDDTPVPALHNIITHMFPANTIHSDHIHNTIHTSINNWLTTHLNPSTNFEISSEWNNILHDSTDGPSAVELEYNMMMFNAVVASIAPPDNAPVNPADSFDSVD